MPCPYGLDYGATSGPVPRARLSTWVVHDLNHIGQIVEGMSHQYGEAVGPWRAYLNILTRPVLTE